MKYAYYILLFGVLTASISCSPSKGNRTGHEFMPDMVHSTGYEANLYDYYWFNRWGTAADYKTFVTPKHSVPGTIARGQVMWADAPDVKSRMTEMNAFEGETEGSIALTPNGSVPYYYGATEPERLRATKEITTNPFPITSASLIHGKEMYNIYCGICHGEKGDGRGYLVRDEDPVKGIPAGLYPAAPANFMLDTFINSSPGRIYHAIMHGRNMMGSYADKLSYKERWEVIHYIRSLQAISKKMEYSPALNTFNHEATPWAVVEAGMKKEAPGMSADTAAQPEHSQGGHGNSKEH
ncbi:MAG TPA: cytochrome c [Saprospiraceae bacterium]|nr:cytochrome c [Saprospiraceae bacterium]